MNEGFHETWAKIKHKTDKMTSNHFGNDTTESHLMFYLLIWSRNLFTVLDIEH